MKIQQTLIKDLVVLSASVFTDDRGYFAEVFRKGLVEERLHTHFVQENESFSKKGVLRGLHYQKQPFAQAKLVRCVVGEIFDIAVDLRKGSDTFGQHFGVYLSGENKKQLFIPKGFAHGFVVVSDWAIVSYKVDNYYNKESEVTINYNDLVLNIDWKIAQEELVLSDKDKRGINFEEAPYFEL